MLYTGVDRSTPGDGCVSGGGGDRRGDVTPVVRVNRLETAQGGNDLQRVLTLIQLVSAVLLGDAALQQMFFPGSTFLQSPDRLHLN